MAVNDRLKKLITPQDDEDYDTDKEASTTAATDSPSLSLRKNAATSSPQSQATGHASSAPQPVALTPSPSHVTGTPGRETQEAAGNKTVLKPDSPKMGRTSPKTGRTTATKLVNQPSNGTQNADTTISSGAREEGESGEVGREEREKGGGKETDPAEPRLHLLAVLGVLIPHMKYTLPETRMETLRWLMWLHQQLPKRVRECMYVYVCVCDCEYV